MGKGGWQEFQAGREPERGGQLRRPVRRPDQQAGAGASTRPAKGRRNRNLITGVELATAEPGGLAPSGSRPPPAAAAPSQQGPDPAAGRSGCHRLGDATRRASGQRQPAAEGLGVNRLRAPAEVQPASDGTDCQLRAVPGCEGESFEKGFQAVRHDRHASSRPRGRRGRASCRYGATIGRR